MKNLFKYSLNIYEWKLPEAYGESLNNLKKSTVNKLKEQGSYLNQLRIKMVDSAAKLITKLPSVITDNPRLLTAKLKTYGVNTSDERELYLLAKSTIPALRLVAVTNTNNGSTRLKLAKDNDQAVLAHGMMWSIIDKDPAMKDLRKKVVLELVKNKNMNPLNLHMIISSVDIKDMDINIARAALNNPNTNSLVLISIILKFKNFPEIVIAALKHKHANEDLWILASRHCFDSRILDYCAESKNPKVLLTLAIENKNPEKLLENPVTPLNALYIIVSSNLTTPKLVIEALKHQNGSEPNLWNMTVGLSYDTRILDFCAQSKDIKIKQNVANQKATLLSDKVFENLFKTSEVKRILLKNYNPEVRKRVVKYLKDEKDFEEMSLSEPDPVIREEIAKAPVIPLNTEMRLAGDKDLRVRSAVLKRKALRAKTEQILSSDSDEKVLLALAKRPQITSELAKENLSKNKSEKVQLAVLENIKDPKKYKMVVENTEHQTVLLKALDFKDPDLNISVAQALPRLNLDQSKFDQIIDKIIFDPSEQVRIAFIEKIESVTEESLRNLKKFTKDTSPNVKAKLKEKLKKLEDNLMLKQDPSSLIFQKYLKEILELQNSL